MSANINNSSFCSKIPRVTPIKLSSEKSDSVFEKPPLKHANTASFISKIPKCTPTTSVSLIILL